MSDITKTKVDLAKIKKAVQGGIPLSVTTYTFPHEAEVYISEVIAAFFHEINQENMTEYIIYSLNELITNAKKANTARIAPTTKIRIIFLILLLTTGTLKKVKKLIPSIIAAPPISG